MEYIPKIAHKIRPELPAYMIDERRRSIYWLWKRGHSYTDVANVFNLSKQYVHQQIEEEKRLKLPIVRRRRSPKQKLLSSNHAQVGKALKSKKIVKDPICAFCTKKSSVAHHPDYSKPLEVMWVCRPCHAKLHTKIIKNK